MAFLGRRRGVVTLLKAPVPEISLIAGQALVPKRALRRERCQSPAIRRRRGNAKAGRAVAVEVKKWGQKHVVPAQVENSTLARSLSCCMRPLAPSHGHSVVHYRRDVQALKQGPEQVVKRLVLLCFSGSGGGTRTPDTRIMIPLL